MTDGAKAQWREWMDRAAPGVVYPDESVAKMWRQWFDGDACLAVMSARTGPDVTTVAAKKCDCSQCNPNGGE